MNNPRKSWTFTRRGKWILYTVFVVAIVNFAVFFVAALHFGGDAINGYAQDGHYFLSSHGVHTEVSRAVWRYSYFHTFSVFLTHGLTVVATLLLFATGDIKK